MKRLLTLIPVCVLLTGCFQEMKAEDIFYEVFENDENQPAYKIEFTTKSDGEDQNSAFLEWRDEDGNYRSESYENDEINFISVRKDGNSSHKDYENESIMYTNFEEDQVNPSPNPSEEIQEIIKFYSGDFDIKLIGTEDILDRKTYHLRFDVKEEHNIGMIGEIDLWVDSSTWVILKETIKDGETLFEREAKNFETLSDFPEGIFELDNDEGFTEDDFEDEFQSEATTLEEASETFPVPFLILNEDFDFESGNIRPDYMFDDYYTLQFDFRDDRGLIDVYIEHEWGLEDILGLAIETTVRDQPALLIDEESLLSVNWQENGLQYLLTFNGDYTREDAEKIISDMEFME